MFSITRSPFDFFGGSWTPTQLATLRQWLGSTYYSSPVGGLQVIESLETHGTVRAPQPGACWHFDGVNDYASGPMTLDLSGNWTITIRFKFPTIATVDLLGCGDSFTTGIALALAAGYLTYVGEGHSTGVTVGGALSVDTWYEVAIVKSGTTVTIYLDGVSLGTLTSAPTAANADFEIGSITYGVRYMRGVKSICRVRIYNAAKTLAEVQAIAACDGSAIDNINSLGIYHCNERAGLTGYDSSGNEKHLTLSGPVTESTFHATDSNITSNSANTVGFTPGFISNDTFIAASMVGTITFDIVASPSTTSCVLFSNSGFTYMFVWSSGAGTFPDLGYGTVTTTVDGVLFTGSRGDLYDLICDGLPHSCILTTTSANALYFGGYAGGHFDAVGVAVTNLTINGITVEGNGVIPRDESDTTKDVLGTDLQYTGKTPYPAVFNTRCLAGNGSSVGVNIDSQNLGTSHTITLRVLFLELDSAKNIPIGGGNGDYAFWNDGAGNLYYSASGVHAHVPHGGLATDTWYEFSVVRSGTTVTFYRDGVVLGTPQTLSSNADLIVSRFMRTDHGYYLNGYLSDVRITAGGVTKTYSLQEGPGSSNTNTTVYWYGSDGTYGSGTVVGGTVATQWANSIPGYVRDHAFEYGGRLGAAGQFIPQVPNTSLCADGNAPTILPGTLRGNPFSTVNFNPWLAAEANGEAWQEEYDSLPCVTGNGSNAYADLGTQTGNITEFSYSFYAPVEFNDGTTGQPLVGSSDVISLGYLGIFGGLVSGETFTLYTDGLSATCIQDIISAGWHHVRCIWNGSSYDIYLDGVQRTTYSATTHAAQFTNRNIQLLTFASTPTGTCRIANLKLIVSGTTKYFPLTDGQGDDIAMYENGVATILSNAIQGTLTNVWANKTEGLVDHTYPEAMRAIVPRDQQFNDGESIHFATKDPLTGANLTNALDFLQ